MMGFPKRNGATHIRKPRYASNPLLELDTVVAHWKAENIVADGGNVISWASSVGSSVMNPVAAAGCIYETGQLPFPNLRITANNGYLQSTTASNTMNTFVVCQIVTNQDYASIVDHSAISTAYHGGAGSTLFHQPMAGQLVFYNGANVATNVARPFAWTVVRVSTPSSVPINMIGKERFASTRVWLGRFAEIVLVNGSITDSMAQRITMYLCAKFGITYQGA